MHSDLLSSTTFSVVGARTRGASEDCNSASVFFCLRLDFIHALTLLQVMSTDPASLDSAEEYGEYLDWRMPLLMRFLYSFRRLQEEVSVLLY